MEVLSIWQLSVPLPAVMLITVSLYMIMVGIGLWIRFCLKDHCSLSCGDCCPDISVSEQCYKMAETCDCRMPSLRSCLINTCPSPAACPSPSRFEFPEIGDCCPPRPSCLSLFLVSGLYVSFSLKQRLKQQIYAFNPQTPQTPSTLNAEDCSYFECGDCCSHGNMCELCLSSPCGTLDCACTCHPPECDSCNCLCFEIRIK